MPKSNKAGIVANTNTSTGTKASGKAAASASGSAKNSKKLESGSKRKHVEEVDEVIAVRETSEKRRKNEVKQKLKQQNVEELEEGDDAIIEEGDENESGAEDGHEEFASDEEMESEEESDDDTNKGLQSLLNKTAPALPLARLPKAGGAPSVTPQSASSTRPKPRIIVVLLKSSLETIKSKKGYELVSADTHKSTLQRLKKNPSEYRPDITHQCLLTLLDSPLNKAGMLQVYIQTDRNVLISLNPTLRVPRTFKRFAGLMVQLLHKLKIRSTDSSEVLLTVIKNPITTHLPVGSLKLGTSVQGELVDMMDFAANLGKNWQDGVNQPIVFAVGSHASGPANADWAEKTISFSKYPLSASVALSRLCYSFEHVWNIV